MDEGALERRTLRRLVLGCMVLSAVAGALLGGELVAGMGVVVNLLGWVTGAAIGGAFGYAAALPYYRDLGPGCGETEPTRGEASPCQHVSEDVTKETPADRLHVARLLEERSLQRTIERER